MQDNAKSLIKQIYKLSVERQKQELEEKYIFNICLWWSSATIQKTLGLSSTLGATPVLPVYQFIHLYPALYPSVHREYTCYFSITVK